MKTIVLATDGSPSAEKATRLSVATGSRDRFQALRRCSLAHAAHELLVGPGDHAAGDRGRREEAGP